MESEDRRKRVSAEVGKMDGLKISETNGLCFLLQLLLIHVRITKVNLKL